jgi:hypothetical protein
LHPPIAFSRLFHPLLLPIEICTASRTTTPTDPPLS